MDAPMTSTTTALIPISTWVHPPVHAGSFNLNNYPHPYWDEIRCKVAVLDELDVVYGPSGKKIMNPCKAKLVNILV
jgi:hypothetical protein